MKTTIISLAILTGISTATVVQAADHTITMGYAQSKVQDFTNIQGVNAKYRYEWDSPVTLITSFTYLSGNKDSHYSDEWQESNHNAEAKYYSLAVGPAYRINDVVSLYGLVGVNYSKVSYNTHWKSSGGNSDTGIENNSGSSNSTNLMYGAGVQINPWNNLTIDVGYEGSTINDGYDDYSVNGFNVGIGYRF
ncbi:Ail/Lom family outer membrane beta-barrel protein [Erwinia billingiae]|uniref:Ail/Lom family outer membrane beta-barrel protein n=1 Tax=Erwinia billingiae TaxID=182337 RepID=UPI002246FADF|nr:Ail/Lom family outer membrane beta-barrel protein [Erwinia billingiae]MCX0497715.1 Ail/Lom family protein [Erwinia billingiae]